MKITAPLLSVAPAPDVFPEKLMSSHLQANGVRVGPTDSGVEVRRRATAGEGAAARREAANWQLS